MNRWLTVLVVVMYLALPMRGSAQPYGDSNADGNVNGTDFLAVESCLLGPLETPSGACQSAFDILGRGVVDLHNFVWMQRAASGGQTCTRVNNYVGAEIKETLFGAIGAAANIQTRVPSLCSGASTHEEASAAWIGVVRDFFRSPGDPPITSIQLGYIRGQKWSGTWSIPPESPGLFFRIYVEAFTTSDFAGYQRVWFSSPPAGTWRYSCQMLTSPSWLCTVADADGFPIVVLVVNDLLATSGWAYGPGNLVAYTAEMFNFEDHTPGSTMLPCDFTDCEYTIPGGAPLPALFDSSLIEEGGNYVRERPQHNIVPIDAVSFRIWDSRN